MDGKGHWINWPVCASLTVMLLEPFLIAFYIGHQYNHWYHPTGWNWHRASAFLSASQMQWVILCQVLCSLVPERVVVVTTVFEPTCAHAWGALRCRLLSDLCPSVSNTKKKVARKNSNLRNRLTRSIIHVKGRWAHTNAKLLYLLLSFWFSGRFTLKWKWDWS